MKQCLPRAAAAVYAVPYSPSPVSPVPADILSAPSSVPPAAVPPSACCSLQTDERML